ncbi:unnamed protein product [Schistocephalus solidus]|uniref:MgtE domain-containing protein n=1 Tax=Schistocephalus solidus TaxID=70667 RepID=A0A183SVK0_SCHSO|nr:unnamed protein product [Schistocephalus solidus]
MLVVIFICKRFKIDPDNVAAPLAAALGDSVVLFIMTGVLWLTESGIGGNLASVLISRMTTRLSAASTPIVSDGVSNCIHRVRFLSCTASRDEVEFKHRRSPSMNRRISEGSDVFAESSFTLAEDQFTEALSHGGSAEITLVAVRVAISDSVLTGWNLMIACIPLHLILLVVNSALSHLFFSVGLVEPTAPVTAFTPAVIFAHVSASFLQVRSLCVSISGLPSFEGFLQLFSCSLFAGNIR